MAVGTSAYLVDRLYHRQYISWPESIPSLRSLVTHRRVKVNKDRTRDIFAISGLGEKGLIGAALTNFIGNIGIFISIWRQAVFE